MYIGLALALGQRFHGLVLPSDPQACNSCPGGEWSVHLAFYLFPDDFRCLALVSPSLQTPQLKKIIRSSPGGSNGLGGSSPELVAEVLSGSLC